MGGRDTFLTGEFEFVPNFEWEFKMNGPIWAEEGA